MLQITTPFIHPSISKGQVDLYDVSSILFCTSLLLRTKHCADVSTTQLIRVETDHLLIDLRPLSRIISLKPRILPLGNMLLRELPFAAWSSSCPMILLLSRRTKIATTCVSNIRSKDLASTINLHQRVREASIKHTRVCLMRDG